MKLRKIKKKFPIRNGIGKGEISQISKVITYYKKKKEDIGYNGIFENKYCNKFVKFQSTKGYADVVATGTLAIFNAIQAFNLKKNSEVLVSPITDAGTLSPIILLGFKPKIMDTEKMNYNVSLEQIKKRISKKTKLVLIVHAAGKSVQMKGIKSFLKKKKIFLLEDCSQAHGAKCFNCKNCGCKIKVGNFGDISVFSTMNRKIHMTGPTGGVTFTKSRRFYLNLKAYSDRGKPFWKKKFDERNPNQFLFPALNLNSNEINCAMGISSLKRLNQTIKKRFKIISYLKKKLEEQSTLCKIQNFSKYDSPFFITVNFKKNNFIKKIDFANKLLNLGVPLNPDYKYLTTDWPWLKKYLVDKFVPKNAKEIINNSYNLYINENYTKKDIDFIVDKIFFLEKYYCK